VEQPGAAAGDIRRRGTLLIARHGRVHARERAELLQEQFADGDRQGEVVGLLGVLAGAGFRRAVVRPPGTAAVGRAAGRDDEGIAVEEEHPAGTRRRQVGERQITYEHAPAVEFPDHPGEVCGEGDVAAPVQARSPCPPHRGERVPDREVPVGEGVHEEADRGAGGILADVERPGNFQVPLLFLVPVRGVDAGQDLDVAASVGARLPIHLGAQRRVVGE
jgi:hypothetical protein